MARVRVERELCIGAAECARIAAEVFQLDQNEIAVVVDQNAGTEAQLEEAARKCPAGAIFLGED
ncbi:MAG: ferredoxin [Solirubrobacterales bacterium]